MGTVTEIYNYMRLLFARIGVPYCPVYDVRIEPQSPERIADPIASEWGGSRAWCLWGCDLTYEYMRINAECTS